MIDDVRAIINNLEIDWEDLPKVLDDFFYARLNSMVEKEEDLLDTLADLYYASAADMKLHPAVLSLKNKEYSRAYAKIKGEQ